MNLCISAVASNQGKTILTTALLWYFRDSVRPFKIGPDFIDPQFHKRVSGEDSVNLDSFIMSQEQVAWIFHHYADKKVAILEGVMGFYDGEDRGCSAYSISKLLQVPTILVLDGAGSYITISALLKGLLEYKEEHTIKAVVLNNLSSEMHYTLIKNQIAKDHPCIEVVGWIQKNLPALKETHLGLDLEDLTKIEEISKEVLEHIEVEKLYKVSSLIPKKEYPKEDYPFPTIRKIDKKLAVINDENFSFLYYDNLLFLKETFKEVIVISAVKDEAIPTDCDAVYICGGYVETKESYERIKGSKKFKKSLIAHAKKKAIYGECAGLLYLGKRVEKKEMSAILDIEFTLSSRFTRLGYYINQEGIKGHAFHYTKPTSESLSVGFDRLTKSPNSKGEFGSWSKNRVFGTYLHTMFRSYPKLLNKFL